MSRLDKLSNLGIPVALVRSASYRVGCDVDVESIDDYPATSVILRCIQCKEKQIQTVCMPCMHASFCAKCAREFGMQNSSCLVCHRHIEKISGLKLCCNLVVKKKS